MSFCAETAVKATRKLHQCDGCPKHIEAGSPALRCSGVGDDGFWSAIYHPECRAAEIELNHLRDTRPGDDWARLDEMETDDWEWLLADHPIVAERFSITAERIEERKREAARCREAFARRAR